MKLRDLAGAFRRSAPREFGWEVQTFDLPRDGSVRYAQWLHPGELRKTAQQFDPAPLRAFLRPGDVAIDIGAHTGDSTLAIALAVGGEGLVYALEPNPYVFKILEVNAGLNPSAGRIVPLNFAAMPEDGTYEFTYTDEGFCNGGDRRAASALLTGRFSALSVSGRDLVKYLMTTDPGNISRVRYIKVDTEGADPLVVASLKPLITAQRPYLKTEIFKHLSSATRDQYFDDLRSLGYRLFTCGESDYRGAELTKAGMHRSRHFDIFAVPEELG